VNILDTDALSHHMKMNSIGASIEASIKALPESEFWITSISVFEMVDGALALHKDLRKKRKDLIPGFNLIQEVVEYLSAWRGRIHPYDVASDQIYRGFAPSLRQQLGDDVRIASIALARGAAVWTCNLDDFKRVPGLTVHSAETGVRVT
jgi:predicted nucleic acid-binding protein